MKEISELTDVIAKDLQDKLEGKNLGMTCGFAEIDQMASRLQYGQLYTIGGFTGTGKSYFVLNMLKNIRKEKEDLKVAIFSVELTEKDYLVRFACMLCGIYKIELQKYTKDYKDKVIKKLVELSLETSEKGKIHIYGDVFTVEEIEKRTKENDYDIIFIDYVQELSIGSLHNESDTMPIMGKRLKKLAMETKTAVIAVSQINNYSVREDFSKSKAQPFSFGKQLINASSTAILLERNKRNDVYDNILICRITKARDGVTGVTAYQIEKGYNLTKLDPDFIKGYLSSSDK